MGGCRAGQPFLLRGAAEAAIRCWFFTGARAVEAPWGNVGVCREALLAAHVAGGRRVLHGIRCSVSKVSRPTAPENKHRSPGNERRRSAWPFACSTRPVGGVFAAVASLASGRPGFESRQTAAEMPARPAAVRDIHTFDAFVACGEKRFMLPSERVVAIGYPHRDFPDDDQRHHRYPRRQSFN